MQKLFVFVLLVFVCWCTVLVPTGNQDTTEHGRLPLCLICFCLREKERKDREKVRKKGKKRKSVSVLKAVLCLA